MLFSSALGTSLAYSLSGGAGNSTPKLSEKEQSIRKGQKLSKKVLSENGNNSICDSKNGLFDKSCPEPVQDLLVSGRNKRFPIVMFGGNQEIKAGSLSSRDLAHYWDSYLKNDAKLSEELKGKVDKSTRTCQFAWNSQKKVGEWYCWVG
ncbi:hypothetical protein MSU_0272 [Mycoplasma suis str. Illinois]|uniref:Uncharacterized protein n=1 Tax=Mycoplasma suis (strain Illinois) TaxID=768700 RepID=F0QQP6_MYCSL|nr:hypothetical protein MSU_0272 [Mycoplasma suis str. Illinois]